MAVSQSYALTLALVFCLEYWLKRWREVLDGKISRSILGYVIYRFFHLFLLVGAGLFLYSKVNIISWIAFSVLLVLVGCLEVPVTMLRFRIQKRWEIGFYQLNYLIPVLLVVLSQFVDYRPLYNFDYRMIFLVIFLADPTNYLIRWTLGKDEPSFVKTTALQFLPGDKFAFASESAATTSTDDEARLKVGRKIGTLERFLILFLVSSGNVASIGLVITAKSIVRYPRLSEPEFAEYYLFGTLLSVVLALASCFLILGGI